MSFAIAFPIVHRLEGGTVNDPDDPGGYTVGGVTQPAYDEFRQRKGLAPAPVASITPVEIEGVYRMYWDDVRGSQLVLAGGADVALVVFDCAINQGRGYAPKLLQWALDLRQDGIIGPGTLSALEASDKAQLVRELLWGRMHRYVATVRLWRKEGKPDPAKFLAGWFNRLHSLQQRIDPRMNDLAA